MIDKVRTLCYSIRNLRQQERLQGEKMYYKKNGITYLRTKDGMVWEVLPPKKSKIKKILEKIKRLFKK